MVTLNPQIIKIPAFMTKFIDVDNLSMFQKVKLVIKGKLTTIVFNNFSGKNICLFQRTQMIITNGVIFTIIHTI